jgi:hypothetical protein
VPLYLFLYYFSELLQIESLSLKGKAIEGDMLTAVEVVPDNEYQRNIWNKYKREITYQWYVQVMYMLAISSHTITCTLFLWKFMLHNKIPVMEFGMT